VKLHTDHTSPHMNGPKGETKGLPSASRGKAPGKTESAMDESLGSFFFFFFC